MFSSYFKSKRKSQTITHPQDVLPRDSRLIHQSQSTAMAKTYPENFIAIEDFYKILFSADLEEGSLWQYVRNQIPKDTSSPDITDERRIEESRSPHDYIRSKTDKRREENLWENLRNSIMNFTRINVMQHADNQIWEFLKTHDSDFRDLHAAEQNAKKHEISSAQKKVSDCDINQSEIEKNLKTVDILTQRGVRPSFIKDKVPHSSPNLREINRKFISTSEEKRNIEPATAIGVKKPESPIR